MGIGGSFVPSWRRVVAAIAWSQLPLWSPNSQPAFSTTLPPQAPGAHGCPGYCQQRVLTSGGADQNPVSVSGGCKAKV